MTTGMRNLFSRAVVKRRARLARLQPNAVLRHLLRAPVWLYRARLGWVLGNRFLVLVHIGRRTGRLRRTPLEVLHYSRDVPEWVVMSAFGRDADWLRNIEAQPHPEVMVGP